LLHDAFGGYTITGADGPSGKLGRWQVRDLAGPRSRWQISRNGSDFEMGQTTKDVTSILAWANTPATELPDTDPGQPLKWTDYRMTTQLDFTDGKAGVVWRYRDAGNHYRFTMEKGSTPQCKLIRVVSGGEAPLVSTTTFTPPAEPFAITVEVVGDTFNVYHKDTLILSATDSAIDSGSVGFYTSGTLSAKFSDIYVDDFSATAPAVYRFSFLSSRFKNFKDHLESFDKKTSIATIATGANAAPFISAAKPINEALADPESRGFAGLLALVPGVATTPVVRVTRVEQDAKAIGFLVQSPEPLDWERIDLTVKRAPQKDAPYTDVQVKVLRKADGAGMMIVAPGSTPSGSLLPQAEYRLLFTYRRDNRTKDPNSDVLSEAGITSPEVVTLDLPWEVQQQKVSVEEIVKLLVPA
jgi:hypothetical protein